MEYILENVWTNELLPKQKHVLIQHNVVRYVSQRPFKTKCPTVNSTGMDIIPGYVFRDFSLEELDQESLWNQIEQLIKQGCTTVVTTFSLNYAKAFGQRLSNLRDHLSRLPIDYVIGVSIPMTRVTPALIRTCQKNKIPFINAIIEQEEDLDTVVWEWIRNVNFPYTVPIIGDWGQLPCHEKRLQQLQEKWQRICKEKSIETMCPFPLDNQRFSKQQLQHLGVYPKKGSWVTGCDVDYLIYQQCKTVDGVSGVQYDKDNNPIIVVKNGTVIKTRDDVQMEPGRGKELLVIRPGLFRAMSQDLI